MKVSEYVTGLASTGSAFYAQVPAGAYADGSVIHWRVRAEDGKADQRLGPLVRGHGRRLRPRQGAGRDVAAVPRGRLERRRRPGRLLHLRPQRRLRRRHLRLRARHHAEGGGRGRPGGRHGDDPADPAARRSQRAGGTQQGPRGAAGPDPHLPVQRQPGTGPDGHWTLDEGQGTVAADRSRAPTTPPCPARPPGRPARPDWACGSTSQWPGADQRPRPVHPAQLHRHHLGAADQHERHRDSGQPGRYAGRWLRAAVLQGRRPLGAEP